MAAYDPEWLSHAEQVQARRVFEETLQAMQAEYACTEDFLCDARATNAQGEEVVVARYKVYRDGRIECFEILDEVLWPRTGTGGYNKSE